MIGSVFAHDLDSGVVKRIKYRAAISSLDWIDTQINPEIMEDFRKEVDAAINGSAGALRELGFLMPRQVFQNDFLFDRCVDPTPFIQSIAVLAFVHALDNEDRYPLYDDEDSSSSTESEEAAIDVLRECCPAFSREIELI